MSAARAPQAAQAPATDRCGPRLTPAEVCGHSMSPWLRPGDLLLVDRHVRVEALRFGEVVVMRHRESGRELVHRVVAREPHAGALAPRTKGDRNREPDGPPEQWTLAGRVVSRHRGGRWRPLRWRRLLGLACRLGLYPGQRLPATLARSPLWRAAARLTRPTHA